MPAAQLIGPLQHMLLISHIAMSGPSECHCYLSDCQQSLLIQPAVMSFVQNHSLLCPEDLLMPAVARWPPIWHILPKCSSSLSLSLPHTQTHTLTKTLHTGCPAYAPVAVKRGGPATNNPSRKKKQHSSLSCCAYQWQKYFKTQSKTFPNFILLKLSLLKSDLSEPRYLYGTARMLHCRHTYKHC